MSVALVIIKKDLGGHTWSNTHAVLMGGAGLGVPTDADLASIGAGGTFTATQTSGANSANFLQRLINFERLLHGSLVHFNEIYLTDGRSRKDVAGNLGPTVFYTAALDLTGTQSAMGPSAQPAYMAGAITWLVRRTAAGFSHKPGRMYIRGALSEAQVQFSGPRAVDWESTGARDQWSTLLANAPGTSKLSNHLQGGPDASIAVYCIPHYATANDQAAMTNTRKGDLINVFPVTGFSNGGVVNRQVQRGKKKKATV